MAKKLEPCEIKLKYASLPCKEFLNRESVLTDLFKNDNIKTIYYFCLSIFLCLLVTSVAEEYLTSKKITFGFTVIYFAFYNIHTAIAIWLVMLLLVQIAYLGLKIWTSVLHFLQPNSRPAKIWNTSMLSAVIPFYVILLTPTYLILKTDQPIASSLALMIEQIRLLMKTHAFLRTNIPTILNYKPHSEKPLPMPSYKQFLYFLFAPTLVYKGNYPRTKEIRWGLAFKHFAEVVLIIFYMSFLLEKFFMVPFSDTCLVKPNWNIVIKQIFLNLLPGMLLFFCHFYIFQHSWLNGFAELLTFGDRLFYKEWWTSSSYAKYFRTWNTAVYDWLYTYVYNDMYQYVAPGRKQVAKFVVFFVSALFHEYIVSFTLRMFFPVMFFQFFLIGCMVTFTKNLNSIGNVVFWFMLEIGQSIMMSLYAMELFARYNCPGENKTSYYFIPRLSTCNCYE